MPFDDIRISEDDIDWLRGKVRSYPKLFERRNLRKVLKVFKFRQSGGRILKQIIYIIAGILVAAFVTSVGDVYLWPENCYSIGSDAALRKEEFGVVGKPSAAGSTLEQSVEWYPMKSPWQSRICYEGWYITKSKKDDPLILKIFYVITDEQFAALFAKISLSLAIVFGGYHWFKVRRQAAITDSFERKYKINQSVLTYPAELGVLVQAAFGGEENEAKTKEEKEKEIRQKIFVYLELDNLEFAFEKYGDDEIQEKLALRQCLIFASRCLDETFKKHVKEYVLFGMNRIEFITAVSLILDFAERVLPQLTKSAVSKSTGQSARPYQPPFLYQNKAG